MFKSLALLVALSLSAFSLAADAPAPWQPDKFPISYWCGPPPEFNALERYQEIREANFTLAFPPCAGMTVEQNLKLLDHCQAVGLKAFVHDSRMPHALGSDPANRAKVDAIIKDYSKHPALAGYHIVDEPGAGAFPGLAEVVAYLKEKDPAHPGYINLLPTYGRDFNVLGTKTYEEHVRKFAETVKPFAISYDHYHFTHHGDRADFFENLDTVRKVALEHKLPFWNIVLTTQHFDYRHLGEPELRFEAMQTLAYGGKGLLWFTYWSPQGPANPGTWKHAIVDEHGKRDPHYDMIKQINADVLAIGGELLPATSTVAYQIGVEKQPPATTPPPEDPPVQLDPATKARLTVGLFTSPDGKTLCVLANLDYKQPADAAVSVRADHSSIESFDPDSGQWSPANSQPSGDQATVAVELPAGGAILLRW